MPRFRLSITSTPSRWPQRVCGKSAQRGHNAANVRQRDWFTRLRNDVNGAAAELAVAKFLGIPWSRSVGTFTSVGDVADDIDVRHTERAGGRLILREKDFPGRWVVFVTGSPPNLVLQGYIRAEDGMQPQWRANPHDWHPAWFLPASALLPIEASGEVPPCLRQPGSTRPLAAIPTG